MKLSDNDIRSRRVVACMAVFVASVGIMVLELVAGRLIARHLGQSLYTWTSCIGIFLTGISIGNVIGGRLADRYPPRLTLGVLFLICSATGAAIPLLNLLVSEFSWLWYANWPWRVFLHTSLVFILPALALGTVGPVAARFSLGREEEAGRALGMVYAWGAVGSIVGTYLTGFVLIAHLGSFATILAASLTLAAMGIGMLLIRSRLCVIPALLVAIVAPHTPPALASFVYREPLNLSVLYEEETAYSYLAVKEVDGRDDRRALYLDRLMHSVTDMAVPDRLHYEYQWINEAALSLRTPENQSSRSLIIGGGGYVLPRYLYAVYPQMQVDVVEIDPRVTTIAKEWLDVQTDERLRAYDEEARTFMTDLVRKPESPSYNYLFGDCISDYTVPFHLTTVEFLQLADRLLDESGMYMFTLIDLQATGRFLASTYVTCREAFPHVAVISCQGRNTSSRGLFVVLCSKQPLDADAIAIETRRRHPAFHGSVLNQEELASLVARGQVLTDDHAPVENMIAAVVRGDRDYAVEKLMDRGVAAAQRGEIERAVTLFIRAQAQIPLHPGVNYNLALAQLERGRPKEALDALAAAVTGEPSYVPALELAGSILVRAGYPADGAEQWRTALRYEPERVKLHNNLGNVLMMLDKPDEARTHWEESVRLDSTSTTAHHNLGAWHRQRGNREEALRYFRRCLEIRPDMPGVPEAIAALSVDEEKTVSP